MRSYGEVFSTNQVYACLAQAARLFTVAFFVLRGDLARTDERAGDIKPRSASLTASSFGNAFAISGSSTITFVDSRMRAAYLPRTSLPKSDRLYSGRDQSLSSDLAFFIDFSLLLCRTSSADYANGLTTLRV